METEIFTLTELFKQLGLDSSDKAIDAFIASHGKIPKTIPLHEAPCWTQAQSQLLRESIEDDSAWADVVDHLDVRLR